MTLKSIYLTHIFFRRISVGQVEIFGPVLTVQTFQTEEEAIKIANDTKYGLTGGVFTSDIAKGHRVVRQLRAGITSINSYDSVFSEAPWGGYKKSGIGRELGTFGLNEYLEIITPFKMSFRLAL